MENALFDNWSSLLRTLTVGGLSYVVLILFLRLSGKRTLSKLNAFDLVVTVALGSTLATILLSKEVSLAQGALAFSLLIGMQFIVTWSSVRIRWLRRLVTGEPALLLYRGQVLEDRLRRVRLTREEVHAAVRATGIADLCDVQAVVLETDGSLSVVRGGDPATESSLGDMQPTPRSADS